MQKSAEMAVADVNAHGGVAGRKLQLVSYDPQSDNSKYAQYANQLAEQDKVDVVMGGITSAYARGHPSRHGPGPRRSTSTTSPTRAGSATNTFLNGATLDQTIAPLMPLASRSTASGSTSWRLTTTSDTTQPSGSSA